MKKKEALLPKYRRRAPIQWLVLIAEGYSISSMFDMPELDVLGRQRTGFERVYYFDNFRQRLMRLSLLEASQGA